MRYIDADELLNKLPNDLPYKASVKRVLIQAPTAEVAPRAEVDKLKATIERLEQEKAEMLVSATTDIPITMETLFKVRIEHPIFKAIKSEVAREIFEEIEELIVKPNGMWLWQWDLDKLAELKKKYTEDSDES